MRKRRYLCTIAALLLSGLPAFARKGSVDCSRGGSLSDAIAKADPGDTLTVVGTCAGPVVIDKAGLTIQGSGPAAIDGQQKDAVTVSGARGVTLANLEVRNGANGVVAKGGANLQLVDVAVHDNASIGVFLEANSSATIAGGSTRHNGLNGIDAEGTSAVILTGSFTSEANAVFGININNASSLTFAQANVTVDQNVLGIQIGTSAGAFITDPSTTITVTGNFTTGLTIVSGAHMVAFGGTILAQNNGFHGVSVDSKAGLDLDAAASLTSTGNAQDGVHLEETSVLTMFNTPAFSGAPGVTTVTAQNNGGNGVNAQTGSSVTVIHQAAITSTNNQRAGILADNGSSVTLVGSTVTGNQAGDVLLTFGSRADLTTTTIGTIHCDATALIRGDTGTTCPK